MAKLVQYSVFVFLVFAFCFLLNPLRAQHSCRLIIRTVDTININILNIQHDFDNKTNCIQYINRLPSLLAVKGYAAASVDSVWEDSVSVSIKLFMGKKYQWKQFSVSDSDYVLLNSLGYTTEKFNRQNFSPIKLEQLYNDVLNYYNNNGYPFSEWIYLDSVNISNNNIAARVSIKRGALYYIDTIIIEGNARISKFSCNNTANT
jgi:outer membrane protein assembly factor BamA